ncbi:hypothetical protein BDW42DRAFT_179280, partial [Aspergillus taichungensis]
MPTGGGKSMLFMLPAWVTPGGTTVVIIINKYHIMINQDSTFYLIIQELDYLQHHQVPVILLTAILPPTK